MKIFAAIGKRWSSKKFVDIADCPFVKGIFMKAFETVAFRKTFLAFLDDLVQKNPNANYFSIKSFLIMATVKKTFNVV